MPAGAENDLGFRMEQFGRAKMRSEKIGQGQRQAFDDMARMLRELRSDGIALTPDQVTLPDPVQQAAWEAYVREQFEGQDRKRPLDPPMMSMDHEHSLKVVG